MKIRRQKVSSVFVEVSGICNARCPYCGQRRLKEEKHLGAIMSPNLFEKDSWIISLSLISFERGDRSSILLYNWGEPFLNPEINAISR